MEETVFRPTENRTGPTCSDRKSACLGTENLVPDGHQTRFFYAPRDDMSGRHLLRQVRSGKIDKPSVENGRHGLA